MGGLITVSAKRNRIYHRAFDHEQAQALHAAGHTYREIAGMLGVSSTAVARVCDPRKRESMDQRAREYALSKRKPCRGGCGQLVWCQAPDRSGYCAGCAAKRKAAAYVRDNELRCTKCGEWKPDDAFLPAPRGMRSRRGRRNQCRSCSNAARVAYRRAHLESERRADNERYRKGRPMTRFVVLRKTDDGCWEERSRVEAATRLQAIERAADGEGTYAAVSEGQLTELPVKRATAFKVVKDDAIEAEAQRLIEGSARP